MSISSNPAGRYDECLTIRRHCDHPFVLDEVIDSIDPLLRGHADRAMDVVNIKISKFGGLTKARQARDLCVSLGIAMTIEDSWGGDITTAAIAHLAHSTPPEYLFTSTDFNSYVTVSTAEGPRSGKRAGWRPRSHRGWESSPAKKYWVEPPWTSAENDIVKFLVRSSLDDISVSHHPISGNRTLFDVALRC